MCKFLYFYVVFTDNISDIVNSLIKHIEDKHGTAGHKSVEGLPVQEKSTTPKPLGEGVLQISTAGVMGTKSIKDEGILHDKSVEGLPVQEKSTSPKPFGEGVLEMSTAGSYAHC